MADEYRILAAAAQATRRKVEALTLAMGGALGVAAEPYPHQVATVRRILSDTRVRHLIADEVGLGKTVQALMVLNALRWQNPRHKAVVLVPDRLVSQWLDECWTRCHSVAAVVGGRREEDRGGAFVRIVRPQSVQSGQFVLDPSEYDLLVVDEPQTMPVSIMGDVERAALDFRQLLMLSATPGLGDPAARRRIMKLLEPERVMAAELTGVDADEALAEAEAEALAKLAAGEALSVAALYRAFSSERRIARARRSEWGRYLPGRKHERIEVEPLKGEADRVRIGMRWLTEAGPSRADDGWRFAQALHRGARSARGAVQGRMRRGEESRALAAVADACSGQGDSRFDALVDVLRDLWAQDARRQVVVVASDNPTIDFISSRLPRYFGTEEEPLEVTQLRRASEASDDEVEDVREMYDRLDAFIRGQAKVLLVGEWIQAGLNLHYYARDMVFYSPPWDPEAVDQLVGRLDRLRPNGLRRGDSDRGFGRIRTWCITQHGTVEAKVVDGLEASGVFARPLPPVPPEEAEAMHGALKSLAFGQDREGALAALRGLAERWDGEWSSSRLADLDPHTPEAAQAAYDALNAAPLPEPVLRRPPEGDREITSRAEVALRGWLDLMNKGRFFEVGKRRDRIDGYEFGTLWHPDRNSMTFPVPELEGRNMLDGHAPFVTRRRHLATPPRNKVVTDEGEKGADGKPVGRLLRFLDHGDALHESLVRGFAKLARDRVCDPASPRACLVQFPEGHPALELAGQTLLVQLAFADPGEAAFSPFDPARLRALVDAAPTDAQKAALSSDALLAEDAWRCDQRWVRGVLPALMLAGVSHLNGGSWTPVAEKVKWEVLKPLAYGERTVCAKGRPWQSPPSPAVVAQGIKEQTSRIITELRNEWKRRRTELLSALEERRMLAGVEAADLLRLRKAEFAKRQLAGAGTERFKEGQIAAAGRRVAMADAIAEERAGWLRAVPTLLEAAKPTRIGLLVIRPAAMETS